MSSRSFARRAGIALALIMVLPAAACGGGGEEGDQGSGKVTLEMAAILGAPNSQTVIQELIDRFEAKNPEVDIKPTFIPYASFNSVVVSQYTSGNPPDILYTWPGAASPASALALAHKDALLDMSDQPWVSGIPEEIKPVVSMDGGVYAWPQQVNSRGIIYNMTALERVGVAPPKAWSEVLPYCEAMNAAGLTPYMVTLGDPTSIPQILDPISASTVYAENPTWDQDRTDEKTTFSSTPGWRTALEKLVEMQKADCFPKDATTVDQNTSMTQLMSGKAAAWFATYRALPYLQSKTNRFEFLPFPAEESDNWAVAGPDDAWAVSKDTKHRAEALAWVAFMAAPAQNRWVAKQFGGIAMTDYAKGTLPELEPELADLLTAGKVDLTPKIWSPSVIDTVLGPGVQSLYLGDTSISSLLEQMDHEWDATK